MTAIGIVVFLFLVWALFPESGAESTKNFICKTNAKWMRIFGKVEEENNEN